MVTRNVVLTEPQDKCIDVLIEISRSQNASEVIREDLRLLENQEAGLFEALVQAGRGEMVDGEEAIRGAFERA